MTLIDVDVTVIESLEFEHACEGRFHARGLCGHDASQPGEYIIVMPCCGPSTIICVARKNYIRSHGALYCRQCGKTYSIQRIRFEPIS